MGAKETIMSPQDIKELKSKKWGEPARNYDYTIEELMVAEAQAEITGKIMYKEGFKAGQESIMSLVAPYFFAIAEHRHKAGIREVVEWIDEHKRNPQGTTRSPEYTVYLAYEWQNQLKDWGLKDGK